MQIIELIDEVLAWPIEEGGQNSFFFWFLEKKYRALPFEFLGGFTIVNLQLRAKSHRVKMSPLLHFFSKSMTKFQPFPFSKN